MDGDRRGISKTRSDRGRYNGRRSKSRSPSRAGRRSKSRGLSRDRGGRSMSRNPRRGRRFKSRSLSKHSDRRSKSRSPSRGGRRSKSRGLSRHGGRRSKSRSPNRGGRRSKSRDLSRHGDRRSKSRSPSRGGRRSKSRGLSRHGGRRSKSRNPSRGRRFKSRSRGTKNPPEDYFSMRMNKDIETSQSASISSTISFEERVNEPINSQSKSHGNITNITIRSLGDKYSWETYEKFLKSFISGLLKKLSKKDITLSREIYGRDSVNIKGIEKRLKHLSTKGNPTLEVGLEMAYGAYKLNDLTKEKKILEAGEKAHKAAALFLQAEILREEGEKLLDSSQSQLRNALRKRKKKYI